jgi:hypothetical protein
MPDQNTLYFKDAIIQWEHPVNEKMISYSALTRKANKKPTRIFGSIHVSFSADGCAIYNRFYDVGLRKEKSRWVVDKSKFRKALHCKITAIEEIFKEKNITIEINYPVWYCKL